METVKRSREPSEIVEPVNVETVEVLYETGWRLLADEDARRTSIEGKAASLATFAALILTVASTFGKHFLEISTTWALAMFLTGLTLIGVSAVAAIFVLLPRKRLALAADVIRAFPTRTAITKPPDEVRGELLHWLVRTLVDERERNQRRAWIVFGGFVALLAGLILVVIESATVAIRAVQ